MIAFFAPGENFQSEEGHRPAAAAGVAEQVGLRESGGAFHGGFQGVGCAEGIEGGGLAPRVVEIGREVMEGLGLGDFGHFLRGFGLGLFFRRRCRGSFLHGHARPARAPGEGGGGEHGDQGDRDGEELIHAGADSSSRGERSGKRNG